uniref:PIR2-like helical domain-containing protein n=1 Tax=Aegilops tauschii TaxID=37682 RepID=M8CLA2_AEGTA
MAGQRNRIRRQRAKARSMSEAEAGAARVPEVEVDGEVVTAGERNCVVQRKIPLSPKEELRRSLISQIRGYYLDAISRLPTTELATTLARGLLVAGHCYGPLHPVHNIIVNSVWHSAAFPMRPGDRIDAAVVSSDTLSRLVQRSLDGLVASLRHLCPGLSDDDDALWHLSLSRADLRAAVASARGAAPSSFRPTASELEAAFEAAAKAARHPKHRGTCALRLVRCRCHECLTGNFQIDHPDDSENFSGWQYYTLDGTVKDLDCPSTSDADYRCFDPVRDIGFVEYLDQDFTHYRQNIDLAINGYCSAIM